MNKPNSNKLSQYTIVHHNRLHIRKNTKPKDINQCLTYIAKIAMSNGVDHCMNMTFTCEIKTCSHMTMRSNNVARISVNKEEIILMKLITTLYNILLFLIHGNLYKHYLCPMCQSGHSFMKKRRQLVQWQINIIQHKLIYTQGSFPFIFSTYLKKTIPIKGK